jgi:hypothetical protein
MRHDTKRIDSANLTHSHFMGYNIISKKNWYHVMCKSMVSQTMGTRTVIGRPTIVYWYVALIKTSKYKTDTNFKG